MMTASLQTISLQTIAIAVFASSTAVAIAATVVVLAVLGLVLLHRHHRHQLRLLMERLGELEERRPITPWSESPPAAETPPPTSELPVDRGVRPTPMPIDDPLAGQTSHVQRLVAGGGAEAESLADQAIVCVHRHLEESLLPGQLADELYVSIRTLERGLATALGCTPRQLILAVKMRAAQRMLLSGRYQVTEVAHRLAFSSSQHFSRRFKSFYGTSPSSLLQRDPGGG